MSDYLKSISNLEKDITVVETESPVVNVENPIVSASSIPPLITEADSGGVLNQKSEILAEYQAPKTIIVRKYRLKK